MVNFFINVIVDPKRVKTGTATARRELDKTTKTSDKLGKSLRRAFGLIGGGLLLRSSIGILAAFSQEMSTVGAVSNATGAELAMLEERALSLGKTTRFTATEAAKGLTELARAGLSVDQANKSIGTSLTLAQAGGVSIADAAAITTTALKVFNIAAADSERVADTLVIAANSAKTNVNELGQAFTFVAANANDLNISMEDTTAALGVLAEGGLTATRGGTALRSVLLGLAAPTREAEAAILGAGLSLADVDIQVRGLVPVLQTLSDAQLDSGEKAAIFGKRFSAASSILFNNLDKFDQITDSFKELGGEAQRVADAMDDNLNGALLRARSAFQGLILSIGQSGGLETLTTLANGTAVAFNFLGDNVEALGVSFGVLAVGFALTKIGFLTTTTISFGATAAYIANSGAASALAVAHTGLGVAALNAAAGLKAAAIAAATNPFGVLVIGATAAFVAIKELTEILDLQAKAREAVTAGKFFDLTEFAVANERVRDITDDIKGYATQLKEGSITQQQFALLLKTSAGTLEFYRNEVDRLSGTTEKAKQKQRDLIDATEELNLAFGASKQNLQDQATLLGFGNQEREIQSELLKEIQAIQEAGGPELTDEQNAELEALLRSNQALEDRADALDSIRGPQEEFIRELSALQGLLADGTIDSKEFDTAIGALASSTEGIDFSNLELPEGLGADVDFEAQIAGIQAVIDAELARIETEQLRNSIIDQIIGNEARLAESQVILKQLWDDGTISADQYAIAIDEINTKLNPLTESQKSLAETLNSIKGPQEDAQQRFADLGILLREEKITIDEYNAAVGRMDPALLGASASVGSLTEQLGSGLLDGLKAGVAGITDVAGAAESLAVNSFGAAEDALVSFITTGEADFEAFVDGFLEDLARLIAKQALFGLISSFGGGGLVGAAGATIPGFAKGGDFDGTTPFIAGEEGPELIMPKGAGSVKTAAETAGLATAAAAPAPQVNVTVLNSSSPEDTISAMSSAQGTQLIMNAIQSNPSIIKNSLQ
tara:strand:+ start:23482 stop:26517 length:3036 start_codon:yes stop_codon:yes gene_type:complete